MRLGSAKGDGNLGFVGNLGRIPRGTSTPDNRRVRGVTRRGTQDRQRCDGSSFWGIGFSCGHSYSPIGSALETDQWKERGSN